MMRIVEISPLPDGAHRSQGYHGEVMDGYALIPEDMETQNFPYGEVEVAEIDGILTVTKWTPGIMPEPVEPVYEPTTDDVLNTLLGVTNNG